VTAPWPTLNPATVSPLFPARRRAAVSLDRTCELLLVVDAASRSYGRCPRRTDTRVKVPQRGSEEPNGDRGKPPGPPLPGISEGSLVRAGRGRGRESSGRLYTRPRSFGSTRATVTRRADRPCGTHRPRPMAPAPTPATLPARRGRAEAEPPPARRGSARHPAPEGPAVLRRANPARQFAGSCASPPGPTQTARPHSRSTHGAQRQIIVRLDMHTARHAATVNPSAEGTPTIAH
jgi:hypothetical protein